MDYFSTNIYSNSMYTHLKVILWFTILLYIKSHPIDQIYIISNYK